MRGTDSEHSHVGESSREPPDSLDEPDLQSGRKSLRTLSIVLQSETSEPHNVWKDEDDAISSLKELRAEVDGFARMRRAARAKKRARKPKAKPVIRPDVLPHPVVQLPAPPPSDSAEILRATASMLRHTREVDRSWQLNQSVVPSHSSRNNIPEPYQHSNILSVNTIVDRSSSEFFQDDRNKLKSELAEALAREEEVRNQFQGLEERYVELEKLVSPDLIGSDGTPLSDREIDTDTANDSCSVLRKHLGAYAIETVALRRQIARANGDLHRAGEALKLSTQQRDESVLLTTYLESELSDLKAACKKFEKLLEHEAERRHEQENQNASMQNRMDILNAALESSHDYNQKEKLKTEGHIQRVESRLGDKDKDLADVRSLVTPLTTRVTELQVGYTSQTREYDSFVSKVHAQQQQADHEMKELWQTLSSQLEVSKRRYDALHETHITSLENHKTEMKRGDSQIVGLHSLIKDLKEQVTSLQAANQELSAQKPLEQAAKHEDQQQISARTPKDQQQISARTGKETKEEVTAKEDITEEAAPKKKPAKPEVSGPRVAKASRNICKEMSQASVGVLVQYVEKTKATWSIQNRLLRVDDCEKSLYCYKVPDKADVKGKLRWRWADAGFRVTQPLVNRNPLRWSDYFSPLELALDLENSYRNEKRPVLVEAQYEAGLQRAFESPEEAIRWAREDGILKHLNHEKGFGKEASAASDQISRHTSGISGIDDAVKKMTAMDMKLELQRVLRLEYSCYSVPCIQLPSVPPWLSFSLYTIDGSFDFVCTDEDSVRCLVLALSRLCLHANGTIKSRSQFEAAKGWIKVEDMRLRKGKTWHQVLLKSLRAHAAQGSDALGRNSGRSKGLKIEFKNSKSDEDTGASQPRKGTHPAEATEDSLANPAPLAATRKSTISKIVSIPNILFKSKRRTKKVA